MPLVVKSICYYLTVTDVEWRDQDYSVNKLVKVIKGQEFRGYMTLRVSGEFRRFTYDDSEKIINLVAKKMGKIIENEGIQSPILVPVPNSVGVIGVEDFETNKLANKIAGFMKNGAEARSVLRWKRKLEKSHMGGSRNPIFLFNELKIIERLEKNRPHILIDDVCTTGAHLTAASALLTRSGVVVPMAMTVAKTTNELNEASIKLIEYVVDGPERFGIE
jgi:hypothetical protein